MKNTDKITLTVGQLKKLVKESRKELLPNDEWEAGVFDEVYQVIANAVQSASDLVNRKPGKKYKFTEADRNEIHDVIVELTKLIVKPTERFHFDYQRDEYEEF